MNPQPAPDLGYADPPPAPELAGRAREHGRALRRRRRTGIAACVLVLVTGIALGAQSLGGPAELSVAGRTGQPVDLAKLPVASGRGPSVSHFTSDGWAPGEYRESEPVGGGPIEPIIRLDDDSTPQPLMWISKNASVCLGERASTTAAIQPSTCNPLKDVPAEGLWGELSGVPRNARRTTRRIRSGRSSPAWSGDRSPGS